MAGMTEGYRACGSSPFLGRYMLKRDLSPWELSNLSNKTPIRQLSSTGRPNTTNTETAVRPRLSLRPVSEASLRASLRSKSGTPDGRSGLKINNKVLELRLASHRG